MTLGNPNSSATPGQLDEAALLAQVFVFHADWLEPVEQRF